MSLLVGSGVGNMVAWLHDGKRLVGAQMEANFIMIDVLGQSKADGERVNNYKLSGLLDSICCRK